LFNITYLNIAKEDKKELRELAKLESGDKAKKLRSFYKLYSERF